MKKVYVVLAVLTLIATACGSSSGQAKPTPISLPTALPTQEVATNPTARPDNAKAGDERSAKADGMAQVFIPDGSFQMGGVDSDAQPDEKPLHKVTLTGFWMDKVEVTNYMYSLCVQAGACDPPREFKSATRDNYFTSPDFQDYPVIYVSWQDANNYCTWAGRRLPTEAEWEYAARGSADYRRFPWGEESPTNSLANYDYQFGDTTRVGSFPSGASPFGVLDLAGNVWEWVSDFYSPTYYSGAPEANPTGPVAGANGPRKVIRGGSWADGFKELRVSNRGFSLAPDLTADSKSEAYMGQANDHIGIRCAANK
jgi:formylglycine-generating enzyme required for sulfatase activity